MSSSTEDITKRSTSLRGTWSSQSRPVHMEIRPRDTYQHYVMADAGDLISWSFFTRRKNIAFGLFYLLTPGTTSTANANTAAVGRSVTSIPSSGKNSPSASPHKPGSKSPFTHSRSGSTVPEESSKPFPQPDTSTHLKDELMIKEVIRASRSTLFINPPASPKPGHGSTSVQSSRANSTIPTAALPMDTIGATASNLSRSQTLGVGNSGGRLKFPITETAASTSSEALAVSSSSMPDLRLLHPSQDEELHLSIPSMSAPNAVEYMEILPVERYESFASTITGHYQVPISGTFILYFDNSYSINTPKELFLTVHVGPAIPSTTEILSGWLLKKKRGRLQGWARRWFQLDQKGILSYFADRFSPCRGSIDLHQCTVTKIPARLMITVDSDRETYHLRSSSLEDYTRWSECFTSIRSQIPIFNETGMGNGEDGKGILDPTCQNIFYLSSVALLKYTERITIDLHRSEGKLGELRNLAAHENSPNLQKYLFPLEQTFQSLQQLYGSLSDYAIFLQRSGRRMSQVSAGAVPPQGGIISPVVNPSIFSGEEFFDAEEIILTDVDAADLDEYFEETGEEPLPAKEQTSSIEPEDSRERSTTTLSEEATESLTSRGDSPFIPLPDTIGIGIVSSISSAIATTTVAALPAFRTRMPQVAPPSSVSLSTILRRSIGKDWSTISMPVALNEPLSALQRLCEELEYSDLLDCAANSTDSMERLVLVAAFAVSAYAATVHRAERKPFTPMLGETFEFEHPERGFRFLAEKVVHRPLVIACYAEGGGIQPSTKTTTIPCDNVRNWKWWQDQRIKSKFWGKSMEYIPLGNVHVKFTDNEDHFVWSKVVTCVRNLLSGNKWVENYGEMMLKNERTGDVAKITFKSNGGSFVFSSSPPTITNEVVAHLSSGQDRSRPPITLRGRWDSMLFREDTGEVVWRAAAVPNDHAEYFGFSQFAITLNDLPSWLAPYLPNTDSRLRPDQRCLELGRIDEAEQLKQSLEKQQRALREQMEENGEKWIPRWFCLIDETNRMGLDKNPSLSDKSKSKKEEGSENSWHIKDPNAYWEYRKSGNWPPTPSLW